jgi:hypothetical protein
MHVELSQDIRDNCDVLVKSDHTFIHCNSVSRQVRTVPCMVLRTVYGGFVFCFGFAFHIHEILWSQNFVLSANLLQHRINNRTEELTILKWEPLHQPSV